MVPAQGVAVPVFSRVACGVPRQGLPSCPVWGSPCALCHPALQCLRASRCRPTCQAPCCLAPPCGSPVMPPADPAPL